MIALRKLGSRWTLLVLRELFGGRRRFSELRKGIPQVPAKSLVRVLAKLETDGLIKRTVNSTRPPQVVYSIVYKDPILRQVIDALFRYGSK
jgi:DNA-binding HxlR family transcriptional regulator